MDQAVVEVAEAAGVTLTAKSMSRLENLAAWLRAEAIPAGGLGPHEGPVVEERHLADSLLFAGGWQNPPATCWDLGSGVGLPGLVLACVWPSTEMLLVDRSGRRCELARRGARVIGVGVEVVEAPIEDLTGPCEAVVSRAAIPAGRFRPLLVRLLAPGGVAVISAPNSSGAAVPGFERFQLAKFLDRESRLLIMRAP